MPRWIVIAGHPYFTHENQPDHKAPIRLPRPVRGRLANLSQCGTGGSVRHDPLSRAPVAQLSRAAGAGIVSDLLPDFGGLLAAGQPLAAQSAPTAGRHRRQGPRARPGQTDTHPLRALGLARCPRRLRDDHHRPARRHHAVAPRRSEPAPAGDRLGGGHGARASSPGRGARSASTDSATASSRCWRCSR